MQIADELSPVLGHDNCADVLVWNPNERLAVGEPLVIFGYLAKNKNRQSKTTLPVLPYFKTRRIKESIVKESQRGIMCSEI